LDDGIFEAGAQVGSDISRVLYFFFIGRRIVLTHGFIKKTQKTPISEIELAKKYRTEYINREEMQD
jgi:phage-related protein